MHALPGDLAHRTWDLLQGQLHDGHERSLDGGSFRSIEATGQCQSRGDALMEVLFVFGQELLKAGESISLDELNRARAQYRAGLIMSAESASSRASQIARQLLLFGRPIGKDELMERLSALTVGRLTDLSGRLFSTTPTVAAVGPVSTLASYDKIRDALPRAEADLRKVAV